MTASLHFVFGPTAVGKSDFAYKHAVAVKAPIVVLDRIQTYPELTIVSNRSQAEDFPGCELRFLADSKIVDGELTAVDAYQRLSITIGQLERESDLIFLEGGSMSLIRQIIRHREDFNAYNIELTVLEPNDIEKYEEKIHRRVARMIYPSGEKPTLIDEFIRNYSLFQSYPYLKEIVGYDAILDWMYESQIEISQLKEQSIFPLAAPLIERIAAVHLDYAMQQMATLRQAIPAFGHHRIEQVS